MPSSQSQSPFFSKLPLELRREIYQYTLPESQTIYIKHKIAPPLRIQFRASGKYEFDHGNTAHDAVWYDTGTRHYSHHWSSYPSRDARTLGVYVACWMMYREVTEVLFATKTFFIHMPTTLLALHAILPPPLFASIRSLEIIFCSNFAAPLTEVNAATSTRFLTLLKQLPRLHKLRVHLAHVCWKDYFYYPEKRLYAANQYEREHALYWRKRADVRWEDVEPYLGWVQELECKRSVVVLFYGEDLEGGAKTVAEMVVKDGSWVARRVDVISDKRSL